MASRMDLLNFILDQVSGMEGITWRAMMGEYILYCNGKIIGGVYDDRLLVKPIPKALLMLPEASLVLPYEGGREMLLVEAVDDRELLRKLFETLEAASPTPKGRKNEKCGRKSLSFFHANQGTLDKQNKEK